MTTAGTDDDDEEECFHQSLDRILSSSSSSTSVEDDDVVSNSPSNISPKFPMCVRNYDFWASDAAFSATSLRHRRHHLLCSLGYSFSNNFAPHPDSRIFQSKPEISTCTECDSYHRCASLNDECSLLSDNISPTTVLSVPSVFDNTVNSGLRADTVQVDVAHSDSSSVKLSRTGNESDEMCTTNYLDSGNEFSVNKVVEDYMCAINSPIVEKFKRQQVMESLDVNGNGNDGDGQSKKNVSWFKSVKSAAKSVIRYKRHKSHDREKGEQKSSSAMDGSKDSSFHRPERVRIRWYGNSVKDLTGLYKIQEIQAHNGSIWSIKFSLDGRYLATAGEDCVIHVWQVVESERKFPKPNSDSRNLRNPLERKKRGMMSISQKSMGLDNIVVPETVFGLSEKPVSSFQGHLDDVLDLSWSKSEHLLSSSMDKTVRLWNLSSKTCLKVFSHVGYVTCVQFNPVDDRYFISGSLDGKVRIWSIPDRQVVDWIDLYEMVTAACYTPDGQGAFVGSHNGSCRLYNISENKLQPKSQFNLLNKKKKEHLKKITGFEFAPGNPSVVLITSADSRVRVVDGVDLVLKCKGFCNTDSQISASITTDGKYVVCASEDSNVYIWKHEAEYKSSKNKRTTCSYEHFHCQDVSVAIPWPGGVGHSCRLRDEPNEAHNSQDEAPTNNRPPPTTPVDEFGGIEGPPSASRFRNANPFCGTLSSVTNSYFFDRFRATWPEEKLLLFTENKSICPGLDLSNGVVQNGSAWGLVIVTAGLKGEIRTYQNFGLPARI